MNDLFPTVPQIGKVDDASGHVHSLASGLDRAEYGFLSALIGSDHDIRKTLDVGCDHRWPVLDILLQDLRRWLGAASCSI